MLIFDQLKRNDPQLRTVALVVLSGLGALLAGLWWVQIVSSQDYQNDLENQSFRTVRIPAVRGKILDRDGTVLVENRPVYNVSLYLDELRKPFDHAYLEAASRKRAELKQQLAAEERKLGRKLRKSEKKQFALDNVQKAFLRQKARYEVASNVVLRVSERLGHALWLDPTNFERHYETRLALPCPVLSNLDPTNVARFEEQSTSPLGVDLEVQSTRVYPYGATAGHLLGCLRRDNSSAEGEEAFFSYRLPDFRGVLGIEYGYDKELRGMAGAKSVQVNNMGYRTTENIWSPAEPGRNVVLTIDLTVQQAAERALVHAPFSDNNPVRGAVVVMDVHSGDILAMVSSPQIDPNAYVHGFTREEWQRILALQAEKNRATRELYAPGSIFKTVVGLACLEAGLDPNAIYTVTANPADRAHGHIVVGKRSIKDTVSPGNYDFRRAIIKSSNSYFITNGLRFGPEGIVRLGRRFHFGEIIGLPTRQESKGYFPTLQRVNSGWTDGNTANMCIGQDPVQVTPLQIAVLSSALANGGKVLWPRLVLRIEPQDPLSGEGPVVFPGGKVRDELGVSRRSMEILHQAMLAETEDPEGTGKHIRDHVTLPGLHVCGKTGTAQVQNESSVVTGEITWFASFAPYENPRWAVVVMVENGKSGGDTCAPVAGPVYAALMKRDQAGPGKTLARAQ